MNPYWLYYHRKFPFQYYSRIPPLEKYASFLYLRELEKEAFLKKFLSIFRATNEAADKIQNAPLEQFSGQYHNTLLNRLAQIDWTDPDTLASLSLIALGPLYAYESIGNILASRHIKKLQKDLEGIRKSYAKAGGGRMSNIYADLHILLDKLKKKKIKKKEIARDIKNIIESLKAMH